MKKKQIFRKFAEDTRGIVSSKFIDIEYEYDGEFRMILLNKNGEQIKDLFDWSVLCDWMFKNLIFEYSGVKNSIKDNPIQYIKKVLENKKEAIRHFLMDDFKLYIGSLSIDVDEKFIIMDVGVDEKIYVQYKISDIPNTIIVRHRNKTFQNMLRNFLNR